MSINDLNQGDIFMQTGAHFFQKLLIYDLAKRISAKEALAHPYFGDMNWEVGKKVGRRECLQPDKEKAKVPHGT